MSLLAASSSQLLVVDVQEKLVPTIPDAAAMLSRMGLVLSAAAELQVPVSVSEQYPKGLGPTLASVQEQTSSALVFAKTAFSCLRGPSLATHLYGLRMAGRHQLVLTGIEAHVCVLQTALDAVKGGFEVFVVSDGASSRRTSDRDAGFGRMMSHGVHLVTAEMVLFEWLERAGTSSFKTLSRLLK